MSTIAVTNLKHESAAGNNITLDSSGNVGIGITAENPIGNGGTYRNLLVGNGAGYAAFQGVSTATASGSTIAAFTGGTTGASGSKNAGSINIELDGTSTTNATGRIVFYTGSGGSTTERMRIDSAGRVTMPYQPCFSAGCDTNASYTTFSGVLLWNIVLANVGSHYNSSNGRFTAPVSGNYYFAWNSLTDGGNLYIELNIHKNGSLLIRSQQDEGTNNISGQAILPLVAGDYVDIRSNPNGTASVYLGGNGQPYNQFSGFLIG